MGKEVERSERQGRLGLVVVQCLGESEVRVFGGGGEVVGRWKGRQLWRWKAQESIVGLDSKLLGDIAS